MFEIVTLLVLSAVGGILVAASLGPNNFRVHRSARIKARPENIYPLINDLRAFNRWNPFARKDPGMQGTYQGPVEGPGAIYDFKGSGRGGEGSIEIVGHKPAAEVTMQLNMRKPMRAQNLIVFSLTPAEDATEVTWLMQGKVPFVGKILHLLFSMDKMCGRDFESGLANLKSIAEQTP